MIAHDTHPPQGESSGAGHHRDASASDAQRVADEAKANLEATRQRAQFEAQRAKEQMSQAAEQAKAKLREVRSQAADSGKQYIATKQQKVAGEVGVLGSALRSASERLREEDHHSIASYVDAAAEQIEQVRHSIENKSVSEIFDDVQSAARKRPELVYGGLFVAGLAAIRFIKTAACDREASRDEMAMGSNPDRRSLDDQGSHGEAHQPSTNRIAGAYGTHSSSDTDAPSLGTHQPPIGYRKIGNPISSQGDR